MVMNVPQVTDYIRQAAARRGIDPEIALRVARSEGLGEGIWQSNFVKDGKRETSYGPYQLLVGGGLGDKFQQKYGKSPADPSTVYQQVDFALDEAKSGGWGPWYGAAKVGVGNWDGLGGGGSGPSALPPPNKEIGGDSMVARSYPGMQPASMFGSIAPSGPATASISSGSPLPTIDPAAAKVAFGEKEKKPGDYIAESLATLGQDNQVRAPGIPGFPGGPSQGQATALMNVLANPNMGDLLRQKRMFPFG